MNEVNEGGSAFPVPSEDSSPGMSLRDWFAGQALTALADSVKDEALEGGEEEDLELLLKGECRETAELAYMLADALIDRRDM